MSHPEQLGFFSEVAKVNARTIAGARILEIGSFDVNGGMRHQFSNSREYIGVDLMPGPGVDVISYGHDLDYPDGHFDAALSGECFEHDPYWRETFLNMCRMTRPGGLVAFSCASVGRPEHGTRKTTPTESPGTIAAGLDYYRNLAESDFEALGCLPELFAHHRFWYLTTNFDLYFVGIRAGGSDRRLENARIPSTDSIERLATLMPRYRRYIRKPLALASRVLGEARFQSFAVPYWNGCLAAESWLIQMRNTMRPRSK